MMNRLVLPGLIFFFLVSACAIPQPSPQQEQMPPAVAESGPAPTEPSRPLADLERDMQNVLTASEAAMINRQDDGITVTFRGDATFDTGSALVKPELHAEIARVARVLAQYPELVIRVEGHTDSRGSEQKNMALSKQRADSVRTLLFRQGVGPRWIAVAGFGETRPIATNETEAGRKKNRRVEIQITLPNRQGTALP